jgi:hypothetical protein
MTSDKKVQANRENGRRGKGPTSTEGKAWSERNGLKSGLFSKDLVVAAAGEKQEDYDALLSGAQSQFPPQNFLSAFFAKDLADIIWGLQRVRRYEAAEIRKQCDTARCRRWLEKTSEVDSLKSRFIRDYAALCAPGPGLADPAALSLSLEGTRRQLEKKSLGLDFLFEQIEAIQRGVERDGHISAQAEVLLVAACGVEDEEAKYGLLLNQIAKAEMEKIKKDEKTDKTTFEGNKLLFMWLFLGKMRSLWYRRRLIRELESVEEKAYLASLVMPPAEALEKIHRVEAAHRRNLYKTVNTLLAVFYGTGG